MKIGCHVSIAGGLPNAPKNAAALLCETFQMFSRSPQGGKVTEITHEITEQFSSEMKTSGYKDFVIHAPYIINFGSAQSRIYHGSISLVRTELERGSLLGAKYVMFHPGSLKDLGQVEGMLQAQTGLEKVLDGYTGSTQLLIEISAGAGEVIGDTFEELAELSHAVKGHKGFGGICFDTQHAYASGYDLKTKSSCEAILDQFDKTLGLKNFKMSHINDSKVPLGAKKDRHEHIGEGEIGEVGLGHFLHALHNAGLDIPLILETEHDKIKIDIEKLKSLRDKAL